MLQQIKENLSVDKSLYISLDDLYFRQHTLTSVAELFYQQGGRHLFMDEVHKYQGWQQEVKSLYDFLPELQLVLSGSSILALQQAHVDLSRRIVRYTLPILSFREYLGLHHKIDLPEYSLQEILTNHETLALEIAKQVPSILSYYTHYQQVGVFPFFQEGESDYYPKLNQLINLIIDYDLPEVRPLENASLGKLKKLLYIISTAVPFKPNIQKLTESIGTSRNKLLEMLDILEKSQLIRNLRSAAFGISLLNKPDKIYLHNTNYIHALAEENPNRGNLRETLFMSHVQDAGLVTTYSDQADFMVSGKYTFEIGGREKGSKQIKGIEHSYVIADDLLVGVRNKIPLWLFGFLY
jgi:uncharacterized protein